MIRELPNLVNKNKYHMMIFFNRELCIYIFFQKKNFFINFLNTIYLYIYSLKIL